MRHLVATLSAALALSAGGLVAAGAQTTTMPNDALVCPADVPELTPTAYLRAVSLDLRGELPSVDEYQAVLDAGPEGAELVVQMVDEWLEGEAFASRVVRHHRALLWNNVEDTNLFPAATGLRKEGDRYWRQQTATTYRGDNVPCLDEPAEIVEGVIQTKAQPDGSQREGWVEVAPYWAPDTTWKICAFDAQEAYVSPSGTACNTNAGFKDAGCGCGPGLEWCRQGSNQSRIILRAFAEDIERRIADIVMEDRPYLDLFEDTRAYVNGPMVHFMKKQAQISAPVRVYPTPYPESALPDLAFTDEDTWIQIELPAHHAGILTSPAFLIRFQTNRARANRFYNAFLCESFQPPDGGLPPATDAEARHPDLQKRAGCKYCHALLEPAAAYWGRWTEQGAGWLDPGLFPATRDDCLACATQGQTCAPECNSYYQTKALGPEEVPFLGQLEAYVFLAETHQLNIEVGPSLLAKRTVADHRLPTCVARTTSEWLLGRELSVVSQEDADYLEALAWEFVSQGFSYRQLVRSIVTSDVYRRVR